MVIREATAEDCPTLTELCMRSKANWGYDADFMEKCRDGLSVTPEKLRKWATRVAETKDGILLGVAATKMSSSSTGREAVLDLLFVEPEYMGMGIGSLLLRNIMAVLRREGISLLWILSDPNALGFYQKMAAIYAGSRPSDAIAGRELPQLKLFTDLSLESERG